ncbi:MAG TPA: ABC transporter substrate-binding protein [Chloroflexia bacterium]|nr:ABC transporter substrate-binding protein [Chloroflexia bacterium]
MSISPRGWLGLVLLLAAALLVACDPGAPPQPPVVEDARLGFVFASDGGSMTSGSEQTMAAQMAIDEINAAGEGPRLVAFFEESEGKAAEAVERFHKLINDDKVHAIIGPTLSAEARAAHPVAQRASVPVLAVSNTAGGITDVGDYIFRVSLPEAKVIPTTVAIAKDKLKVSEVCLLYELDDAFSRAEAEVFKAELDKKGVKVLGELTFSQADTDFTPQLRAIKELKPDAIVVSALAGPSQQILHQARNDVGIGSGVYIIGGFGFTAPQVIEDHEAAEGLVVGVAWSPASPDKVSQKFVAEYEKRTGKPPGQLGAQAYAGVYIAYDAIERANIQGKTLAEVRSAIKDNLRGTSDLATVLGPFSFADKREPKHLPVVQVFMGGRFEAVK